MNARGRELVRLGRLAVAGAQVHSDGTGQHVLLPAGLSFVWGKITGRGTGANDNAHSWTEQRNIGDGAFENTDNPIVGDATATPLKNPAYEITGQLADTNKIVQLWPGRPIISGSDYIQPWFFGLGGSETGASLVKVNSASEDANGYHDGTLVTDFSGSTHTYTQSGSIWVRNPNRIAGDVNTRLSVRYYTAWKKGTYSSRDVWHAPKGAECINGVFVS